MRAPRRPRRPLPPHLKAIAQAALGQQPQTSLRPEVQRLLATILALPYNKIVTVCVPEGETVFDIDATGTVGYSPTHRRSLEDKIEQGLRHHGGVIVRQFLNIKVERTLPHGKRMWIPEKNIYGIELGQGTWATIPAKEMAEIYAKDAVTGKPLPVEPDVHFVPWPTRTAKSLVRRGP